MSGLLRPTSGVTTSTFGPRDLMDIYGNHLDFQYWHRGTEDAGFNWYPFAIRSYFHAGTDLAPEYGTPIVASERGLVVYAGWAMDPGPFAGGGRIVDVAIDGGMHYVSNHCSALQVITGQFVERGQQIAQVGNSGNAAGVHDHCAVYTGSGTSFRLHNPEDYWETGKYASSPLILPSIPDTSTEGPYPVWFNNLKPAAGTIVFRIGTHVYDYPGHVVNSVTSVSSAPRVASLLHTDGIKYAAYILGSGGVRLVKLTEVTIK